MLSGPSTLLFSLTMQAAAWLANWRVGEQAVIGAQLPGGIG